MKISKPKIITFRLINPPYFNLNWDILRIYKEKNKRHCLRDWGDGTYTIYPDQCGTPYIFEPLNEKSL